MKNESTADAPFVFTVSYNPSIAQLSVKGRAQVFGEKEEISKMIDEHKQNRPPPVAIIQGVSTIAIAEAILLSKSVARVLWFLPSISAFKRLLNPFLSPLDDQLAPIHPDSKEISLFEWKARIIGQLCR